MSDKDLDSWLSGGVNHSQPAPGTVKRSASQNIPRDQLPTGKFEAVMRGGASGLTAGTWPAIAAGVGTGFGMLGDYDKSKAESEAAQEKAWQDQPGAYGTGYTGGTVAGVAAGPGLLARGGALAAKVAVPALTKAAPIAKAIGGRVAPDLTKAIEFGMSAGQGAAKELSRMNQAGSFNNIKQFLDAQRSLGGIPLGSTAASAVTVPYLGAHAYTGLYGPNLPEWENDADKRRAAMQSQTVPKDEQ